MDRRIFLALAGGLLASPGAVSRAAYALPAPPLRRVRLFNVHTRERFDGPYRDDRGPITAAMDELSYFLRDFHSGERIAIDVGVIDFLAAVLDAVGASRATVLSAYRTVATNRMLARTTFGVADNSQHLYGRALDIRLDFAAGGGDAGGARDAARRRRLVSALRVYSHRTRDRCATGRSTARASTICCPACKTSSRAAACRCPRRSSPGGRAIR